MSKLLDTFLGEFEEWRTILNIHAAPMMFGGALSSASLDYPKLGVTITFMFVAAYIWNTGKYPTLLKQLKQTKRNEAQNVLYYGLQKTHFGFKASCTKFLPYTLSCYIAASVYAGYW